MSRKQSTQGRRRSSLGTPISLNPEQDAEDNKHVQIALKDAAIKERLEAAWFVILASGDALRDERLDEAHFRYFLKNSTYAKVEAQIHVAFSHFEGARGGEPTCDFISFIKCIFHCGMEKYNTQDYELSLGKMLDEVLDPFVTKIRKIHDVDGGGDDSLYLEHPDVDRLLYVYDGVFDRIFQRYKSYDSHGNRDLTLEQNTILDNFVEMDEMREFAKDYGFFPKFLSFVEISLCTQTACFGSIVRNTGKTAPFKSQIQEATDDSVIAQKNELYDKILSPLVPSEENTVANPLFQELLPKEFLHDEPLLDKNRFMSACVRLAQCLYNRSEFIKRLPTIASRVEEMLRHMTNIYERMFGHKMEEDCDFTEKGRPVLLSSSPVASLSPSDVPMSGKVDVTISGTNFCEKRGVFCRFGSGDETVVIRCKEVYKKRVVVGIPPWKPKEISVDCSFTRQQYRVTVHRIVHVPVECSNNRIDYTTTDPQQLLCYKQPLPVHCLDEITMSKLMKTFSAACSINQAYNSKYLVRENWKRIKALYQLVEGEGAEPGDDSPNSKDVYFLKHAELHEGSPVFALDFKGYLKALARCFFQEVSESWSTKYSIVADIQLTTTAAKKIVATVSEVKTDELTLARQAIAGIEKRKICELDVYCGPVLCGVLVATPGNISSNATGKSVMHQQNHPFLTYTHYDEMNTEKILLGHVAAGQSFFHVVHRILQQGFDVAPKHPKPQTRKPSGRSWLVSDLSGKRMGCLWDYAGQFGCAEWQPVENVLANKCVTLVAYAPETSDEFVHLYIAFVRSKDIGQIRTQLAQRNFILTTKLYKIV